MRTYKKVGFGSLRYIHTVDMCRAFKYITISVPRPAGLSLGFGVRIQGLELALR